MVHYMQMAPAAYGRFFVVYTGHNLEELMGDLRA